MVSFKSAAKIWEKTSSMCNAKLEKAHLKYLFSVLLENCHGFKI
jgi:hypothetical protein